MYIHASLMFIRRVFPEIELFCLISYTKSFSIKLLEEIKTNSSFSLYLENHTTYEYRTCTVALLSVCTFQRYPNPSVWRVFWHPYTEKRQNPLSDYRKGDTALHSIAPLRAQTSYNGEIIVCSSMVVGLPNNEERSPKVASGRKHETVPDNTYFCPIIAVSEFQLWKAIAPEPSNGGRPNFQLEVRRVCTIYRRPHPLPVNYALGASASEYPNIHGGRSSVAYSSKHQSLLTISEL